MIRTQIQLTEEQARVLERLSRRRGVSKAALIREALDRLVEEEGGERRWERALSVVGKFRSGAHDVSGEHDRYLAEDFLR